MHQFPRKFNCLRKISIFRKIKRKNLGHAVTDFAFQNTQGNVYLMSKQLFKWKVSGPKVPFDWENYTLSDTEKQISISERFRFIEHVSLKYFAVVFRQQIWGLRNFH